MSEETPQSNGNVGRMTSASAAPTVRRFLAWMASGLAMLTIVTGATTYLGMFEVAADQPHWPLTERLLDLVRSRSVAVAARTVESPDLASEARVLAGAGNYDAMCAQCHLRPGVSGTELSAVLYPAPPNFALKAPGPDHEAFWVIKHGLKMTGMGAWGKKLPDEDIWNLVAFIRTLPTLSPADYESLVFRSTGHAHGGAERSAVPHGKTLPRSGSAHCHHDGRTNGTDRAPAHRSTGAGSHAHAQ